MRILLSLFFVSATASGANSNNKNNNKNDVSLEVPDLLFRSDNEACSDSVAAWCDTTRFPVHCAVLGDFDEYGCSCLGTATHFCPTECLPGSELISKTKYGIRCSNVPPPSEPNYVLKEVHPTIHRCENNAAVASWCDEHVNKHLSCGLYPADDQYLCKCSGKLTNCPDECIGGGNSEPLIKTPHSVLCAGIPEDTPNYILKGQTKKAAKTETA